MDKYPVRGDPTRLIFDQEVVLDIHMGDAPDLGQRVINQLTE